LGLRKILPSDITQSKKIKESDQSLIEAGDEFFKLNLVTDYFFGRQRVIEKLKKVNENLKKDYGLQLALIQNYRSLEEQKRQWEKRLDDTRQKFPYLSEEEIIREASKFTSKPTGNGPHQTGGAVDLTLADLEGNVIFMGSDYSEQGEKTFFDSRNISVEARKYRNILKEVMEKEDFVNYPAEWWHWSYGDRMWAAYGKKPYAFYGPIEKNI
jgi:D-alanyl-D-alanine dipeptidase